MFCPSDYVVLKLGREQVELLAEARNSYGKVIVVLGMLLGICKCFGIGYVELNVTKSAGACGGKDLRENFNVFVAEKLGVNLNNSRGGTWSLF